MNLTELLTPNVPMLSRSTVAKLATCGIRLSPTQIQQITAAQTTALAQTERIAFAPGAADEIVNALADSPFLQQGKAGDTLAATVEAFYVVRDDVPSTVPDEEIAAAIRAAFDAAEGDAEAFDESEISRNLAEAESKQLFSTAEEDPKTSNISSYTITDSEGRTYRWDPADWEYDELAPGWNGEKWEGDYE